MTQPVISPLHEDLVFHGPLSVSRADQLIRSLGPLDGQHVVDLGCGWAELLLRTLAVDPTATGHGGDVDAAVIEHGRANARARGLADRVVLDVGDAATWSGSGVDVLIVNGASHVWGGESVEHTTNALAAGRALLRSGGRLLLGEGFWQREPTRAQLQVMPIPLEQYRVLPDLVDLAIECGYRLLALSQASPDEWDEFQSQHGPRLGAVAAGQPRFTTCRRDQGQGECAPQHVAARLARRAGGSPTSHSSFPEHPSAAAPGRIVSRATRSGSAQVVLPSPAVDLPRR